MRERTRDKKGKRAVDRREKQSDWRVGQERIKRWTNDCAPD